MELQWIGVAFLLGLCARWLRQPPLLGFLAAGFGLELLGLRPDASLRELAHVGILLLLFTIGLKLDLRSLIRPHVWGSAMIHLSAIILCSMACLKVATWTGLGMLSGLDLSSLALLGFALSFSSTVFAVKVLEERDDMNSIYGRVAIGVLIIQDIAAVLFLTVSKGEWPSVWALGLLALMFVKPWIGRILSWCGHGEMLVLAGLAAALGGAALFDVVGVKADLGALAAGVLCSGHEKSQELSKSLLGLKDVFLVGFFLTVGLTGLPTWEMCAVAVLMAALLPIKGAMFFALFTGFRLRARTSLLASLSLGSFSEFGLIVAAVAVTEQWLEKPWLVTLAIAIGLSLLLSSVANGFAFQLYRQGRAWLARFEREERILEERAVDAGFARVLIFGMGRIGTSAYETIQTELGNVVAGFDVNASIVDTHRHGGRAVHLASATDADFWERLHIDREQVQLVLLAMSSQEDNMIAIQQLRAEGYEGTISATARFDDEMQALVTEGADSVFQIFADAGPAFAQQAIDASTFRKTSVESMEETAAM